MGEYHSYNGWDSEFDNAWKQAKEKQMENEFNESLEETVSTVSVKELDDALLACNEAEDRYQEAHKVSASEWAIFQKCKGVLIQMMLDAGHKTWVPNGMRGFSLRQEAIPKLSKEFDKKEETINFCTGQEAASLLHTTERDLRLSYLTIHSGSFKTLYNKLIDEAQAQGREISIPGVDEPETRYTLVRKRK